MDHRLGLDESFHLISAMPFRQQPSTNSVAIPRHTWTLELLLDGTLDVKIANGSWQALTRGCGALYAPRATSWERNDHAYESLYLLFDIHSLSMVDMPQSFVGAGYVIDDRHGLLFSLLEQIVRHHGLSGADVLLVRGAFLQAMAMLWQAQRHEGTLLIHREPNQGDLLTRVHRFMHENTHRLLTVDDLAQAAGLSPSGFAHTYRRLAGESPMAKFRKIRIDAAKAYLMADRHSLEQIARLTGFADGFHLSRTFKKVAGCSPRHFRSQLLAAHPAQQATQPLPDPPP